MNDYKILIVDDEITVLEIIDSYLETAGYNTVTASSGEEAIEKLDDNSDIRIVITDLGMPGISGIELLKNIKKRTGLSEVIIITGYADRDLVLSALKEGAIDFIRKPFTIDEILDSVAKAEEKINNAIKLRDTLQMVKTQNMELLTYKSLLEKRTGRLLAKQEEIFQANKTISEQKKNLQEKVNAQVKEIMSKEMAASYGEMIQGITHNMNTPLSTISGGLDILKKIINRDMDKGVCAHEAYINRINKISGAVSNVIKIIRNTMSRSRDENTAEKIDLDLNKLLKQELEFLEANMFYKHQVKKVFEFAEEIPTFKSIYSDISQIVMNIIQNALDSMWDSEDKILEIKSSFDEKFIYLIIKDHGCGIPEENRDKIFNIFFTTKPSQNDKISESQPVGNGLGLHMVAQLARRNNIEISLKSELNVGSEFLIKIPIS